MGELEDLQKRLEIVEGAIAQAYMFMANYDNPDFWRDVIWLAEKRLKEILPENICIMCGEKLTPEQDVFLCINCGRCYSPEPPEEPEKEDE